MATFVGTHFSVVTTLALSIIPIEHNIRRYGLERRCGSVRAAGVPVLALEQRNEAACALISNEIRAAITHDRAEAIVLGCAGMADLAAEFAEKHGLPVIDGVSAAVTLMEGCIRMGLNTSRLGAYQPSPAKPYSGTFSAYSLLET